MTYLKLETPQPSFLQSSPLETINQRLECVIGAENILEMKPGSVQDAYPFALSLADSLYTLLHLGLFSEDHIPDIPLSGVLNSNEMTHVQNSVKLLKEVKVPSVKTEETTSFGATLQMLEYLSSDQSETLPSLEEITIDSSVVRSLPSSVLDFQIRILPILHKEKLKEKERKNINVDPNEHKKVDDIATKRALVYATTIGLEEEPYFTSEFIQWRKKYQDQASLLGIDVTPEGELLLPDLVQMKKYMKGKLEKLLQKGTRTLILGLSSHTDSSSLLSLLSETIRQESLDIQIETFHLMKPEEEVLPRLNELVNYLNRDGKKIVNFHIYDMNFAERMYIHGLDTESLTYNPRDDDSNVENIKHILHWEPDKFDFYKNARYASYEHALFQGIRTYLTLQQKDRHPVTISAQELSEVLSDNYTYQDTFVKWFPYGFVPKSLVKKVFLDIASESNGAIDTQAWTKRHAEFAHIPFYPARIKVETGAENKKITRQPKYLQEFTSAILTENSNIPPVIRENFKQNSEAQYAELDVRIPYWIDPFLHYFMLNGLSLESQNQLLKLYPERQSDVELASILMANAMENISKTERAINCTNFI